MGVDPAPLTLRELRWMAEARVEHDWYRTWSVMALLAECYRDPRKRRRPFAPADFDPRRQGKRLPIADMAQLRAAFVRPGKAKPKPGR